MSIPKLEPDLDEHRIRQRLIEAAVFRLSQSEYGENLLDEIAELSGYPQDRVQVYFQSSEDVVMALYARFAGDLESRMAELPDGTLGERFRALMLIKFEIMEPYRVALSGLMETLTDRSSKLGVLSPETEAIRARVRSMLSEIIEGSKDRGSISTDLISQHLYTVYLGIMWLWFKEKPGSTKSETALTAACKAMSFSTPFLSNPAVNLPFRAIASMQRWFLNASNSLADAKAAEVLKIVFKHRRLLPGAGSCRDEPCSRCLGFHLPKASYFVAADRPIHLILPAFPAKSPNRRKTIGRLPDMAEEQSLKFLADVCAAVKSVYPPGLRLTICSDGHVFSDLVGVTDNDVSEYGAATSEMIDRLGFGDFIETFSLSDLYENVDLPAMRKSLNTHYEQTLETLREQAGKNQQAATLVNGIHRFLFEDFLETSGGRSRTQVRNDCRVLAYSVVQRSDGWGRLLSDCFPMALRLSIHPQDSHSNKIGIMLGAVDDVWQTPWHGVALKEKDGYKLMKRHEAEALGAKLAKDGRSYEL